MTDQLKAVMVRLIELEAPLRETSVDSGHGYSVRDVRAYIEDVENLQVEAARVLMERVIEARAASVTADPSQGKPADEVFTRLLDKGER
jgi:hypothetical protein